MANPTPRSDSFLLLQVAVWGSVAAMLFMPPPGRPLPPPGPFWLMHLTVLLLLAGAYLLNLRWAVPRLLHRGRRGLFLLLQVGLLLGVLSGRYAVAIGTHLSEHMVQVEIQAGIRLPPGQQSRKPRFFDPSGVMPSLLLLSVSIGLATARRAQQEEARRRRLEDAQRELERTQLLTELSLLKAQLNPHFFFNTLNNIHALTRRDVERAQTAIYHLSRLMRYVLYESGSGTVLLSQEIRFLKDYIELVQLRLDDDVAVQVATPEALHEVALAPLLLLPFVENAFKHGISLDAPSQIFVAIRQPAPDVLELEVRNTCHASLSPAPEPGGIGLANTQRRLELLYAGRHTLTITPGLPGGEYRVHLVLQVGGTEAAALLSRR